MCVYIYIYTHTYIYIKKKKDVCLEKREWIFPAPAVLAEELAHCLRKPQVFLSLHRSLFLFP